MIKRKKKFRFDPDNPDHLDAWDAQDAAARAAKRLHDLRAGVAPAAPAPPPPPPPTPAEKFEAAVREAMSTGRKMNRAAAVAHVRASEPDLFDAAQKHAKQQLGIRN